jgi:hypothetical protein
MSTQQQPGIMVITITNSDGHQATFHGGEKILIEQGGKQYTISDQGDRIWVATR